MIRFRTQLASLPVLAFGILTAASSHAASLVKVNNWNGGISLPSDVSMYAYVPDKVATNPPLLTLIHYCGGSASAVFNQAKGNGTTNGGVVQAADQYGFIIVVPDNGGRCWDVSSTKTQTRDGGGDSHAIIQMVRYALTTYKANPNRVYSTGDSSGAMTTELLLALYPDVYKAGSAFAGVPAGCANVFDSSGLCGLPAQTAAQWGDRVRKMDPGYTGHRPRVQLVHGDADTTITYKNLAQAINEWTNVLGLPATPTSTSSGLTLGTHQATEQQWKNSCGYLVLDALTSIGGDHGPSDALFEAKYVIPFLGLDKTGDTDPEIAQCGGGGAAGTGGASSIGGATSAGGTKSTGGTGAATGGISGASGGTSGIPATGGASSTGGSQQATGGRTGVGGNNSSGGISGVPPTGGRTGAGGSGPTGGNAPTGGNLATGGQLGQGGNLGTGGSAATGTGGGAVLAGTGGSKAETGGNSAVSNSGPAGDSGGCSCSVVGTQSSRKGLLAMTFGALLILGRRKRR